MGLDIDKCRVCEPIDEEASELFLYFSDTNKSKIALFDYFKQYVYESEREVYDLDGLLKMHQLQEITNMCFWDVWEFRAIDHNGNVVEFTLNEDDVPKKILKGKAIKYISIDYQRKGMTKDFYTNILAGCWYVDGNSDKKIEESEDIIFTNERLNACKQYCDPNQPLLSWKLEDLEFILFDY